MRIYLANRGAKFVINTFPDGNISEYNSYETYRAVLNKIRKIGLDIDDTISFLAEEEDDVVNTIESAIATLETKLQVIRDAVQYSSKLKMDMGGRPSDISVVDLSRGSFTNMNYSNTDRGLVLSSNTGEVFV